MGNKLFSGFAAGGWLVLLWSGANPAAAQTVPTEALDARMQRLEQRLDTLTQQMAEESEQVRQQTRSSTENAQDGRFVIRGLTKDTYLTIGGFIQADFIYSLRPLGQEAALVPYTIPVPNGRTASSSFSINPSRLYVRSLTKRAHGLVFKTWLELDFFSANGTATPRLRHAWAEVGAWGVGQTWSLFMDIDAFPNALEFNGPNAMVNVRQMQLRYAPTLSKQVRGGVSLEQPGSQLRFADSTKRFTSRNLLPDLVGMLRVGPGPHRYLRLAGLLHPLTYHDRLSDRLTTHWGYGLNLTGGVELSSKEIFTAQLAYGQGMGRYTHDLNTAGYDAWLTSTGSLLAIPALATYAFYDHFWATHWNSSVGWAYLRLQPVTGQAPPAFRSSNYGIANLLFVPTRFFKAGIEYQYGELQLLNDQQSSGSRLQLTLQSKF